MYFDTHAHLDDEALRENLRELIDEMPRQKIGLVLNAGASLESSAAGLKIAEENSNIYASVGVHPEYASLTDEITAKLKELLAKDKNGRIKAIGEIGLDYHYTPYSREDQLRVFAEQMDLASETGLPAIIHSREAFQDTVDVIRNYRNVKKVIHCFSGNLENAGEYLSEGCFLSFTGVITFKNAKKFAGILKEIPPDRIFFETDSPYLAPEPLRGTVNSPLNVKYVYKKASELMGLEEEFLIEKAWENAKAFFDIR